MADLDDPDTQRWVLIATNLAALLLIGSLVGGCACLMAKCAAVVTGAWP